MVEDISSFYQSKKYSIHLERHINYIKINTNLLIQLEEKSNQINISRESENILNRLDVKLFNDFRSKALFYLQKHLQEVQKCKEILYSNLFLILDFIKRKDIEESEFSQKILIISGFCMEHVQNLLKYKLDLCSYVDFNLLQ